LRRRLFEEAIEEKVDLCRFIGEKNRPAFPLFSTHLKIQDSLLISTSFYPFSYVELTLHNGLHL